MICSSRAAVEISLRLTIIERSAWCFSTDSLFLLLYDVTCQSFAAPSNWTFHPTFFSARNPPRSYWLCAFISSLSIFRILCSSGTRWGNSHGLALIFWGNLNPYSNTSFSHDCLPTVGRTWTKAIQVWIIASVLTYLCWCSLSPRDAWYDWRKLC